MLTKFIYNNSVYSITSILPFYTIYGFYLSIEFYVKDNGLKEEVLVVTT